MKRIIILPFFLILILSAPANSSDRSDLIRQYMDYSGVLKGIRGMFDLQAEMTLKDLSRKYNFSSAYQSDFREVWTDVMMEDFWSSGGFFDMLKPMFNDLSDSDLNEIIAFFKSPAGKKFANINQELQTHMRTIMPKMEQRISSVLIPELFRRLEEMGWDENGNIKN